MVEVGPVTTELPPLVSRLTERSGTPAPEPSTMVTVMVEMLTPSAVTLVGEATTVDSAASMAVVVRVAEALLPSFAFSDVTTPVELLRLELAPVVLVVVVTATLTEQLPEAGMVPPERTSALPPATVEEVIPPQLLLRTSGVSFSSPAG